MKNRFLILDFGSQYTQLIARKLRELGVYAKIKDPDFPFSSIQAFKPIGIVLSGGPSFTSIPDTDSSQDSFPFKVSELISIAPVLGICYGMQLINREYAGQAEKSDDSDNSKEKDTNDFQLREKKKGGEYGLGLIHWKTPLLTHLPSKQKVWMSYGERVTIPPPDFEVLAFSEKNQSPSVMRGLGGRVLAFQFHPEVSQTEQGIDLLKFFVFDSCQAKKDWQVSNKIETTTHKIRETIPKEESVLCALSGGIDSTVLALLLREALDEKHVHYVFVDTGLLREGELEEVVNLYKTLHLNVQTLNGKELFLKSLKGISDPEMKRKKIGRTFIQCFENFVKEKKDIQWLAQGTLYPDVIESSSHHKKDNGNKKPQSKMIKSHHNVGGLPETLNLKLLEPLRDLFKDEVRKIGQELKLPEHWLQRHPFPGPGLAIRILGEVTEEKLKILKRCDEIYIKEIRRRGLYSSIWQALCVLIPVRTVGVQGDQRTYGHVLVLRAVTSVDGMTADWFQFQSDFLSHVSSEITNKVSQINRVVYDITQKPPGTIEWE